MIHIYIFCDKTLVGKKENTSAKALCENLFKMNFKIEDVVTYCNNYDYASLNFKNKDIYFLLMQKSNATLNSFLANLCGTELKENALLKEATTTYYSQHNIPMDKSSELEWIIPENAICITNPNGKTQGYSVKIGGATIFVLPNNYDEFNQIFNDCLLEYLEQNFEQEYKSETYKTFGLSEEHIYVILKDQIKNKDKVSISIFSRGLDNDIVIKAKKDNEKFEEYRRNIFTKLEKYIYSVKGLNLNEYFEKQVVESNTKISIVGDVAISKFVGKISPNVLNKNITNCTILPNMLSKCSYGIEQSLINEYGEVSSEVAYNLAVNALEKNKSDLIAIALCDLTENNRGLIYIAIGNKAKIDIYKNRFSGNDEEVVNNISNTMLFYLAKKIESRDFKTI